jgi:hypothetical protein
MPNPVRFSTFENYTDTYPNQHTVSDWSEFVMHLAGQCMFLPADDWGKKKNCLMISPATYTPGRERENNSVQTWGGWCALDVDNEGPITTPTEIATEVMTALGYNFLIYGSTKHRQTQHRYRILIQLSRELHFMEIKDFWKAVVQRLKDFDPDPSCKDLSRMYNAPMFWMRGKDNPNPLFTFEFKLDGAPLDVDEVLAAYVPPPAPVVPVYVQKAIQKQAVVSQAQATGTRRPTKMKALPPTTLFASPVVSSRAIETYLNLPKGAHHGGLYTFMASIAGRAKSQGYDITADDLVGFAREIDGHCAVKTNSSRWGRIYDEANRALTFVGA